MDLGEKLYFYRTQMELSQGELAERLEVSRQSVSKWETGASVPELDKLVRLCDVFGISLDELVKGDPTVAPEKEEESEAEESEAELPPARPEPTPVRETPRRAPVSPPWRKTAGLILLCCGAVLFLLPAAFGFGVSGLIIAIPFVLCGGVCLIFRRHIGLWCAWVLYHCVAIYLGFATGTYPFSFLAYIRFYEMLQGINIHIIISLAMFCALAALVAFTVWTFRDHVLPFTVKRTVACTVLIGLLVALYIVPVIYMISIDNGQYGDADAIRLGGYLMNGTVYVKWGIITWLLTVFVPHIRASIRKKKAKGA